MKNAIGFDYQAYKNYMKFITECKNKHYDERLVLHLHHIIPKHLCVDAIYLNSKKNKIYISVEDHVQAHLLLAKLYQENTYEHISNLRSARILNKKSIRDKEVLKEIAQTYCGKNNPFYGKKHKPESRKKMGDGGVRKGKTYEEIYGKEKAEIEKKKRAKKTRTDQQYRLAAKKASDTIKKNGSVVGGKNPWAQPYIINGIKFETRRSAEKHFNMAFVTIQKRFNVIKLERGNRK
jgi:hypothetical protein